MTIHSSLGACRRAVTSRTGRTIGLMLVGLIAMAMIFAVAARYSVGAESDPPEDPEVIYTDMDDDGVEDTITRDPDGDGGGESAAGEVQMSLSYGFDQTTEITLRGERAGDRFGESVAIADLTGNG